MTYVVYKSKHKKDLLALDRILEKLGAVKKKTPSLTRTKQLQMADSIHSSRKSALKRTNEIDSFFSELIRKK